MPWHIAGKYLVNSHTGKRMNKRPLPRARLLRYQRALYANVPEARHSADPRHPRDRNGRWRHKELYLTLKAYNPKQKRVPKGSPKGGQWTSQLPGGGSVLRMLRFGRPNINDYGELYDPSSGPGPYEPWSKITQAQRRGVQEGARAIDKVLKFPPGVLKSLNKRHLVAMLHGREMYSLGEYRDVENRLAISERTPNPAETFVHEFGHLLDAQILGRGQPEYPGIFGDKKPHFTGSETLHTDALKVWRRAVMETPEIKRLLFQSHLTASRVVSPKSGRTIVNNPFFANYLLQPSEVFARAFTQYIARESRAPSLLRAVNTMLHQATYPRYWQWVNFVGIEHALTRILSQNNLLLPPGTKEFQNRLRTTQGRWLKKLRRGRELRLKMYNPRQKRDARGRWARVGAFRLNSRLHAYPAKTYYGVLRRLPPPVRMAVRFAKWSFQRKLNPPTLLDTIEGGVDELYLRKKRRRSGFKAYNPRQRRYPKGNPKGGEWMPVGGVGGLTERLHQLLNPTARAAARVAQETHHSVPISVHREIRVDGLLSGGAYTGERIYVSSQHDRPYMNTAHEIGHAIDHTGLGSLWASESSRELNGFWRQVDRSQKVKELRAYQAMGAVFFQNQKVPIAPQSVQKLLSHKELWARAFEQHYAKHSRHRDARQELRLAQSHPLSYYWKDNDFGGIDREISRVLHSHGY